MGLNMFCKSCNNEVMVLHKKTGICLQCNEQAEFGSGIMSESLSMSRVSRKNSSISTMETVATIILCLGIIASLIYLFIAINEASEASFTVFETICLFF